MTETMRLGYEPPYHWEALLTFLAGRIIPDIEKIEKIPTAYHRLVSFDDVQAVLIVEPDPSQNQVLVHIPPVLVHYHPQILARVTRMFDLTASPQRIAAHLGQDEALEAILNQHSGLRLPGAWDGFEVTIRAILGQQVSVKAAQTLAQRLVNHYGTVVSPSRETLHNQQNTELTYLFPQPEQLAEANLVEIGLPTKRAEAIRSFAQAIASGQISLDDRDNTSFEDAVQRLTSLPGIGPWTAHYVAIRAWGEPDAFPEGDLILRRAMANLDDKSPSTGRALTPRQLRQRADIWRPWRSYAAMLLWRHYTMTDGG